MSSKFGGAAYGMTTFQLSVGLSAATNLSLAPDVVATYIRHVSGSTLFIGYPGLSTTVNSTIFANVLANGFIQLAGGEPLLIPGPSPMALVAAGATVVVSVMKLLGEGYAGAY
jgi:hypothetical protein